MTSTNQISKELKGEELRTFNTLVKLGDSAELAYKTVIAERENQFDDSMYILAYQR